MTKYLFHCENWGHCEQEVLDTLEEAIIYANHEWRGLSGNERRRFKKFKDSWDFKIYRLEISEEDLELWEDGELECSILEYAYDTEKDYAYEEY